MASLIEVREMDKFKAGDEVKRVDNFGARFDGKTVYTVDSVGIRTLTLEGIKGHWSDVHFELANQEWSIYSNTLPLEDLTDEQAGQLFNHKRHGGEVEFKSEFFKGWKKAHGPQWTSKIIYRAKQKSERELFIEAADYFIDCGDEPAVIAGKMFDAGFKAPKGGE